MVFQELFAVAHNGPHMGGLDHGQIIFRVPGRYRALNGNGEILTEKPNRISLVDSRRDKLQKRGMRKVDVQFSLVSGRYVLAKFRNPPGF